MAGKCKEGIMKNDYQPTKEELVVINERFAKEPYKSPDQLHLFPALIIDNRMTAYFTRVHPTFLEQCVKDLFNGVGFLIGHDRDKIPMARSFKGQLTSDGDAMEVFGLFRAQGQTERANEWKKLAFHANYGIIPINGPAVRIRTN